MTEIDVDSSNEAIEIMLNGSDLDKANTVDEILSNPNDYTPPALYALSYTLFIDGNKDKGATWFYIAQLRARIDANLCADETARSVVSILTK